jgi:hypothetical protein
VLFFEAIQDARVIPSVVVRTTVTEDNYKLIEEYPIGMYP